MVGAAIQFLFVFLVAVFQTSFLSVFFPHAFPNLLLATVISWVVTRGFLLSWPWVVSLGLAYDLVSMGAVGVSSFTLVLFAYGISFVSRRFLVEHRGFGMSVAMLFMCAASILYAPVSWAVRHAATGSPWPGAGFGAYFSGLNMFSGIVLNLMLLLSVYAIVSRINTALDFYDDRVIVKR